MSTVIDQNLVIRSTAAFSSVVADAAANDDHVPGAAARPVNVESKGGWNAYDVWRKLIKEARDRREAGATLPR